MDSLFDNISLEDFFLNYWRKKPLLIKGGAKAFWNSPPTTKEFTKIIEDLEKCKCPMGSNHVSRDADEVIFVKHLNHAFPEGQMSIENFRKIFKWANISIDGVRAKHSRSIGSHFDHSDNFVLNLEGKKVWRLHSPDFLSKEKIKQRLLDLPDVGHAPMPKKCIELILEPGDLLYIPLFWIHWGISSGDSYSISVALNVYSPAKMFLPIILEKMRFFDTWNTPIPRLSSASEQDNYFKEIYNFLLGQLGEDIIRQEIFELWRKKIGVSEYLDTK